VRPEIPAVEFQTPLELAGKVEEQALAAGQEAAGSRLLAPGVSPLDIEAQATQQERRRIERQRSRVPTAGSAEPERADDPILPMFRPTRIRETPAGRFYVDPETGEVRKPTVTEEVIESFARQQVLSEEEARERALQIQQEIAEEEGEVLNTAGPVLSGILSEPDPEAGPGITETALGATLRGTMNWVMAAAGEGYFRGLGYEVNELGDPVDQSDPGFVLSRVRKTMGFPETMNVSPLAGIAGTVLNVYSWTAEQAGAEDTAAALETAAESVPRLIVPLPGVATNPALAAESSFDPRARRRLRSREESDIAPSVRRIAQNVASGRGFGDEFLESPEVRLAYAQQYGDPEAAYWAGTIADVMTPAGWGAIPGGARVFGKAASKSRRLRAVKESLLDTTIDWAEPAEVNSWMDRARRVTDEFTAEGGGARGFLRGEDTLESVVGGFAADVLSTIVPGRASDERVLRRVARRAAARFIPEGERYDAAREALDLALLGPARQKATNPREISRQAMKALEDALPEGDLQATRETIERAILREMPDDLVMVSDNVAAPRALAPRIKQTVNRKMREAVRRSPRDIGVRLNEALDRVEDGDPRTVRRLRTIAQDAIDGKRPDPARVAPLLRRFGLGDQDVSLIFETAPEDLLSEAIIGQGSGPLSLTRRSLAGLPVAEREQLLSRLRDRYAAEALGPAARWSRDLTSQQVALDDFARKWVPRALASNNTVRRFLALAGGTGDLEPAAINRIRKRIQAAALDVRNRMGERLLINARVMGGADEALETLFIEVVARDISNWEKASRDAWRKVIAEMYGERYQDEALRIAERLMEGAEEGFEATFSIDRPPSVKMVEFLDRAVAQSDAVPGVFRPDIRKAMLKVIFDEGVRRELLREGLSDLIAIYGRALSESEAIPGLRLGSRAEPAVVPSTPQDPSEMVKSLLSQVVLPIDVAASQAERRFAQAGEEFAQFAESLEARKRAPVAEQVGQQMDRLFLWARDAANGLRYGYFLPNVTGLMGRLLTIPLLSLSNLSAQQTLRALGRTVGEGARRLGFRNLYGGGIKTAQGIYYSASELQRMASRYGLGLTAVDSERVGSLANDLLRESRRVSGEQTRGEQFLDMINPAARGFWMRLAEGYERTFRRSVFEMMLAEGVPPDEAATIARESAIDYGDLARAAQGGGALGQALRFASKAHAEGAQQAIGLQRLMVALARNPKAYRSLIRFQMEKAQAQDPYGVHGDKALKTIGMVFARPGEDWWNRVGLTPTGQKGEVTFYGPTLPVTQPIEAAIIGARTSGQFMRAFGDAAEEFEKGGDIPAMIDAYGNPVAPEVARSVVKNASDGSALLRRLRGIEPPEVQRVATDAVDQGEANYYAALLAANTLDGPWRREMGEQPSGLYSATLGFLTPKEVAPPAEFAHIDPETGVATGAWSKIPEGLPYIYAGRDSVGNPIHYVIEPSDEGLENMRMISAPLPEFAERFGTTTVGALFPLTDSGTAPAASFDAGEVLPTGAAAVINFFTGFTPAGTSDAKRIQEAQAEQIRTVREDF